MSIAGCVGVGFGGVSGALTVTGAESCARHVRATDLGVPVAVATFVKLAWTLASEQL